MKQELIQYEKLLTDIKQRIRQGQIKATLSANAEMLMMYWDVGKMIDERQSEKGWGAKIVPQLAKDIRNELPEIKGFSERNLNRMLAFSREYKTLFEILPQPVAKLVNHEKMPQTVTQAEDLNQQLIHLLFALPWGHNIVLLEKVKNLPERIWYMGQAIENGWSRDLLNLQIKNKLHTRQGKATTNFDLKLPEPQSEMAKDLLKDPFLFDFLTLEEPFHERELETGLLLHLEKFLLEREQALIQKPK